MPASEKSTAPLSRIEIRVDAPTKLKLMIAAGLNGLSIPEFIIDSLRPRLDLELPELASKLNEAKPPPRSRPLEEFRQSLQTLRAGQAGQGGASRRKRAT